MQIEVLKGGWIRQGSVIAFPHEWQRPAKTEEWVFESLVFNRSYSPIVEFICFPWATLIDLLDRRQFNKAEKLLIALREFPRLRVRIIATACQHINAKKIIPLLIELGVTDLYWSHKSSNMNYIDGIRLHPLPLYPIAYYDFNDNKPIPISKRKYKYSFVGAYDSGCYISNVRESILSIKHSAVGCILKRDSWHFDSLVYKKQIYDNDLSEDEIEELNIKSSHYANILKNSMYSLCPSGAGVNSIRLWESICFGCVSVILSDDFDCTLIQPKYNCIKVNEEDVLDFIEILDRRSNHENFPSAVVDPAEFLLHITRDLFDPFYTKKMLKFYE